MGFLGWLLMAGMAYLVYAVLGLAYCHIKIRKRRRRSHAESADHLWLEKRSWLYKYCYGPFDYFNFLGAPSKISTCSLGARFLLMPVLMPVLCALVIFLAILLALAIAVLFIIGFFFAARPAIFSEEERDEDPLLIYYKHWPRWRGRRVWPISVIGALTVPFLFGVFICTIPSMSTTAHWISGLAVLSAFSVIVVSVLFTVYSRSDNWKAVKQGLKDWKDGVCREVELVEKD